MKKLLALHYRPPFQNGRSNSFGQFYFHEIFHEKFNVRGISFGEKGESFENFVIVQLESTSLKKIMKFIFNLRSVRLTHFQSSRFRKELFKEIENFCPDVIYVEHIIMMQYLIGVNTKAKVILFDDDSFLYSKAHNLEGSIFQKMRNYGLAEFERKALDRADYIITITEQEKSYLESLGYRNTFWVPYGIDTHYFSFNWKRPKENSILFVGNFDHYPNREAVKFLSREVLPELNKFNYKLRIVGRNIHRIKKYLSKGIEVFENVPDVRKYYWNSTLFVAPIFSQTGLRIKVLEAAACGIPILLSPLANLGIGFKYNEAFILRTNSKQNFLRKLIEIVPNFEMDKKANHRNMSQLARRKIEENYSEVASQNLMKEIIIY